MAAHTATSGRWPLVARERELGAFERGWGRRLSQGVVVVGAAGVGKTRLAEECLARAVRSGFEGRRVTASAAAAQVPLGAIAHLIPPGVDLSDPVKGFAQSIRALAGPEGERSQRHWAVLVDDLHLLDAASAVLLHQLMDIGLVRLIATLRTGEPTGGAVQALCGQDMVDRIDLDTFDQAQTEAVLQAALGSPVTRRTVHELFTASGGNALYLRELVRGALTDGSLSFDGEIWELAPGRIVGTPRLAELITTRLAVADPVAQEVLDLLAVCEPVPRADVEAVTSDPHTLSRLEQAGLVQSTTGRNRRTLSLAHPLYGETLRSQMPKLRRRQLLLAQIDRTRACGARRREDALRTAAWQIAATGTADPALLTQAAAIARYAHDYPQALTLLEALPAAARTTASRLMHGEVLFELGDPDRAEQVLRDADARAVGEGEVLAVTMARTFSLFWSAGRTDEALAVNEGARARVTSEAGLRMLRYNEGSMRIPSGEPVRGLRLLEDLTDDIRDAPSPEAWLAGAMMKPFGLDMRGRIGEAVAFAEHAYASHHAVGDRALYVHPATELIAEASALRNFGRLDQARETGERGYAELTAASIPVPAMYMAVTLGFVEWLAGHVSAARRWFAEAADRARRHHNLRPLRAALSGLAACAAVLGDLDAADHALTEADPHPTFALVMELEIEARAWAAVARGDLAHARLVLVEGARKARAAGIFPGEAALLSDLARLGRAKEVAGRLAELATQCDGTLVPARARLAAALAAQDPERLISVAGELQAIGADLMAAEAAIAAAAAHSTAGQARKATAAARMADACAARCEGAHTPLLTMAATTAQLTARERDVALLAAHGTSSKEIAEALRLSVRTVENHLQHAYTKLGVTTRRELAQAFDTTRTRPAA